MKKINELLQDWFCKDCCDIICLYAQEMFLRYLDFMKAVRYSWVLDHSIGTYSEHLGLLIWFGPHVHTILAFQNGSRVEDQEQQKQWLISWQNHQLLRQGRKNDSVLKQPFWHHPYDESQSLFCGFVPSLDSCIEALQKDVHILYQRSSSSFDKTTCAVSFEYLGPTKYEFHFYGEFLKKAADELKVLQLWVQRIFTSREEHPTRAKQIVSPLEPSPKQAHH